MTSPFLAIDFEEVDKEAAEAEMKKKEEAIQARQLFGDTPLALCSKLHLDILYLSETSKYIQ